MRGKRGGPSGLMDALQGVLARRSQRLPARYRIRF